jgi:Bacteriocin-protection, YdeI or OmpD-Associated/Domain of unknown function (DUF1905)
VERFEAVVEGVGPAAAIEVPFDPRAVFGRVRAPIRVTINGHTFRTTIARMGGRTFIGLNREVRQATGVADGGHVQVTVELDDAPREIDEPAELAATLAERPALRAFFDALSYTHRREYAEWIDGAKRPETRAQRLARAIDMLEAGVRHP